MSDITYVVAHIKNGVVENTSVWAQLPKSAVDGEYQGGYEYINITDSPVGIGWEYAEGVFTDPNDVTRVWSVPTEDGQE
jgi:hypothetical protein